MNYKNNKTSLQNFIMGYILIYQLGYLKSSTSKNSSKSFFISRYICACLFVCVCVCVRERERERETITL